MEAKTPKYDFESSGSSEHPQRSPSQGSGEEPGKGTDSEIHHMTRASFLGGRKEGQKLEEDESYEEEVHRVTGRSALNLPASDKSTTAVRRRDVLSWDWDMVHRPFQDYGDNVSSII
jgi:hypothetical protein